MQYETTTHKGSMTGTNRNETQHKQTNNNHQRKQTHDKTNHDIQQ